MLKNYLKLPKCTSASNAHTFLLATGLMSGDAP